MGLLGSIWDAVVGPEPQHEEAEVQLSMGDSYKADTLNANFAEMVGHADKFFASQNVSALFTGGYSSSIFDQDLGQIPFSARAVQIGNETVISSEGVWHACNCSGQHGNR